MLFNFISVVTFNPAYSKCEETSKFCDVAYTEDFRSWTLPGLEGQSDGGQIHTRTFASVVVRVREALVVKRSFCCHWQMLLCSHNTHTQKEAASAVMFF